MKGIILAGGSGTRLHPSTLGVSKQLLTVYDKPMVYYPLSVLMLAGVSDVLVISTPQDVDAFKRLLGSGEELGIKLNYAVQGEPRGLAEALLIGEEHIGSDSVALVLGDNIFHGPRFSRILREESGSVDGCVLFGYQVEDPENYGVAETDGCGGLVSIEEKPTTPRSDLAITGLYFYDNDVVDIAKGLSPSPRGELEITDVNRAYVERGKASLVELGRGFAWLDTGTHDSMMEAGQYVRILEHRQGVRIGCVEEVALRMGFIDRESCYLLGKRMEKSDYGRYVMRVADSFEWESEIQ